ncbi:unnamed protein product [Rotaria sp. Silwood1]|nr:unnamed protein product [Rotaria sp. Silwood1]
MVTVSESSEEDLHENVNFHHSGWRITLILLAFISFIITCIFNSFAASDSNDIFTQRTGNISDNNLTEFTPANWTFSIWSIIYLWQAAWLIYAITRISRKANTNYLYIVPNTLHFSVFIFYIINMILNIGWLFIWDQEHFGWSLLVIFIMFITIIIPMIMTHVLLQRNRPIYINSERKLDIWLVRILVHNGLAIYSTWLYLATLLNLTIWITQIYNKNPQSNTNASTAALTLVLVGIIFYFICENFLFYSSMAYTFLPWFVLIFSLSGVLSKNYTRNDIPDRNKFYVLALLIICCILFISRLGLFLVRYFRSQIPTIKEP